MDSKGQLQPQTIDKTILERKEEKRIEKQMINYDQHHGTRYLGERPNTQDDRQKSDSQNVAEYSIPKIISYSVEKLNIQEKQKAS